MTRTMTLGLIVVACSVAYAQRASQNAAPAGARMGFFVSSVGLGNGGDLGGFSGADAHCQRLASAVGAGDRQWHAYLSGRAGDRIIQARDRIGNGPWFNARGRQMAATLADLHGPKNGIAFATAVNEKGDIVPHGSHDILTGSNPDGTLATSGRDTTCGNWTSGKAGAAMVGHHDKIGGPTSWNSAHLTQGCDQASLRSSLGAGLLYCFAAR